MDFQLVAKTIVVNDTGEVLLLRRSKTDPTRPGDWDFPGGGLDGDETFLQAAMRELQEEAGLALDKDDFRLVYAGTEFFEPANRIYFRHLYAAKCRDDQSIKLSFEHDHFEWLDVKDVLQVFQHRFYSSGLSFAFDHSLLKFT